MKTHIPLNGEQDWIREHLAKLEKKIQKLEVAIKKLRAANSNQTFE